MQRTDKPHNDIRATEAELPLVRANAWCLDVIFSEDDSRIRQDHAPRNMTILKRLALNLLRQDDSKGSLKMKRYQAGLNNDFLLQILSNSGIFRSNILMRLPCNGEGLNMVSVNLIADKDWRT